LAEFAVCLPLLLLLVAGIVDCALMIQEAMLVNDAASAGAAYGAIPGRHGDLAGMEAAATAAAKGVSGFSATATDVYACTAGGAEVSSTASCSGYGTPIEYVKVQTSATAQSILGFPGIPSSVNLSGTALFRVEWTP